MGLHLHIFPCLRPFTDHRVLLMDALLCHRLVPPGWCSPLMLHTTWSIIFSTGGDAFPRSTTPLSPATPKLRNLGPSPASPSPSGFSPNRASVGGAAGRRGGALCSLPSTGVMFDLPDSTDTGSDAGEDVDGNSDDGKTGELGGNRTGSDDLASCGAGAAALAVTGEASAVSLHVKRGESALLLPSPDVGGAPDDCHEGDNGVESGPSVRRSARPKSFIDIYSKDPSGAPITCCKITCCQWILQVHPSKRCCVRTMLRVRYHSLRVRF